MFDHKKMTACAVNKEGQRGLRLHQLAGAGRIER